MAETETLWEQLTMATVVNEGGVTEELIVLHPKLPTSQIEQVEEDQTKSNTVSFDINAEQATTSLVPPRRPRGRPPKCDMPKLTVADIDMEVSKGQQEGGGDQGEGDLEGDATLSDFPDDDIFDDISNKLREAVKSRIPSVNSYKNYKGFACEICDKVFTLKGNLKVHIQTHSVQRPFKCSFHGCDKVFKSKYILKKHELAHNGIKPYQCEECQKCFSSKNAMLEHVSRHTNVKRHTCKQCGMEFRQSSCLSRHYWTHREEFPFKCGVCNKRFKSKLYLSSHMRVHTGETPYPCTQCDSKFKHRSDLKRHMISKHSEKKPYACAICGGRFSDPSACRRHEREHNGFKPFICHVCKSGFKRSGQLRQHFLRVHTADGELSASDTAQLVASEQVGKAMREKRDKEGLPDKITATLKFPAQSVAEDDGQTTKIEKRMITHHVAVPKSEGKAAHINPLALLDHINDQLLPGQLPQSVDAQPIEVTCQVVKEHKKQYIVELQYLNTVKVVCSPEELQEARKQEAVEYLSSSVMQNSESSLLVENTTFTELTGLDEGQEEDGGKVTDFDEGQGEDGGKVTDFDEGQIADVKVDDLDESQMEVSSVHGDQLEDNKATSRDGAHFEAVEVSPIKMDISFDVKNEIFSSEETERFVAEPDFSNQEYYNWLTSFADACKVLPMPLQPKLFEKISSVNKKLSDVMANPKGVFSKKNNFVISMSISKDLAAVIDKHLEYVLTALDDD